MLPHVYVIVLVFKGHHHKILRLQDFTFLTVLESERPRSRRQQGWFLQRPLSLAGRWLSSSGVLAWSPCMSVSYHFVSGHQSEWIRASLMTSLSK